MKRLSSILAALILVVAINFNAAVPIAAADSTAPTLASLSFNPTSTNVSLSAKRILVQARVMDETGVNSVSLRLIAPEGIDNYDAQASWTTTPSQGTTDGTWIGTISIPRYAANGQWRVAMYMSDTLGNFDELFEQEVTDAGFQGNYQVISNNPDYTDPQLLSISFNPTSADVSTDSETVVVRVRAQDNLSGVNYISVRLIAPEGESGNDLSTQWIISPEGQRNTFWLGTITIPQGVAGGSWRVAVGLDDKVGNYDALFETELSDLGFQGNYQVTSN